MDPRLLRHYNTELQHLHEMGAEFARQFPKVAARLGMDGVEVADPYVERLLEGAAFLSSRVHLRLDAEFPRFTQRLLEIVYPQLLAPIPSMTVVRFDPDINDPALDRGFVVPRQTGLRSLLGKGDSTACQFRTAQSVTMLPLQIVQAQYFTYAPDLPLQGLPVASRIKGGLRLRLRTREGMSISQLKLDRLTLYLSGIEDIAYRLHELLLGQGLGVLGLPTQRPASWHEFVPSSAIAPLGYADADALLPVTLRGFSGYRLLQEYFAFPQRFLFVELSGLSRITQRCTGNEIDLVIPLGRGDASLEGVVDAAQFSLFCTPAINLFSRRTDRVNVTPHQHDLHIVVDRSRPMDFEVHSVESVVGYDEGNQNERRFLPFYEAYQDAAEDQQAYFSFQREPRLLSAEQKRKGFRSTYVGSELFLSLVDANEAPFAESLKQLAISALCTNRDLPLHMPVGIAKTDFNAEQSVPTQSIRCIRGPTRPHSTLREGQSAWALISHLSLNYLSLMNEDPQRGATALRELLNLYAGSDATVEKQIEGVRSIKVTPVTRRLPMPGPIAFGRGLRLELELNEMGFQGGSPFLFGSVMEQFFARYASLNSFTETVLRGSQRGEIMRWSPRCGERAIL
ncbi:MAG: type VI secretion system baseplate subunit TssF [Panacagrimonas sp.]